MSMYLSIAKFKNVEGKLDANYSTVSEKEVNVTTFINSLIPEKYISEFIVFEDNEELKYREIPNKYLTNLSKEIDNKTDTLLSELASSLGSSKRQEITSNIKDIFLLNYLIKTFMINSHINNSNHIKFLIS